MHTSIPAVSPITRIPKALPLTSYPYKSRYPSTNVECNDIVTPKNHKKQDTDTIYKKCSHRRYHICQSRASHHDRKYSHNGQQSMTRPYAKICLSQHKQRQQDRYSYNAVFLPCQFCIQCDNRHTKSHNKIYFKIIDKNMTPFFFFVCRIFDQLF